MTHPVIGELLEHRVDQRGTIAFIVVRKLYYCREVIDLRVEVSNKWEDATSPDATGHLS
jgi:hypothetical protein